MTTLFPALRSSDRHNAPLVWVGAELLPRCATCGHRQPHPVTGQAPRRTRTRPWRAPRELIGRARARTGR